MPLSPGSSVGHYQILGLLGAGGMGEVYRARDSKLGREVALKVLPDAVSNDAERRARFAREARSLAALNHPNIAQVHGFEDGEPTSALIMELVDGEDLSDRIRRGAIPYDEAIAIARQIGDAMQAAHDRGIIHRDLKPGNIKVREDGTVKVLDFGLAKALDQGSGIGDQGSGDFSNSPTLTTPAMTLRGMILGTAAYMAPEQAKGKAVDRRADIWAFGCVLYEMLTGRKAFAGDDVSDTLASILKSDLDWTGVPPRAVRLLKKCLEKDPRKRLHDIGDAWDLLDDHAARAEPAPSRSPWLPWTLAALFAVSTGGVTALRFLEPPPSPSPSARFVIAPPPKLDFGIYLGLSPDGRRLVFTSGPGGLAGATLWVRDLESLEARQLPGTENASSPFWSPDGKFIAFADGAMLKKIEVSGGSPQKIADSPTTVGLGAWNKEGVIVFGTRGPGPLYRVPASGGTPVQLSTIYESQADRGHSFPVFLPDQKRFLYVRLSGRDDIEGVYVRSIDDKPDQDSGARLLRVKLGPLAVADDGQSRQLLFIRDATLMSQPFDADRVQLSGDAQPVAEHVGSAGSFAFFAAGGDVLAYRTGTSTSVNAEQLTWHDRKGSQLARVGEQLPVSSGTTSVAIAPNGRRAVVMLSQVVAPDLWLVDLERGLPTRLTSSEAPDVSPVWSPDGRRLAFRSSRADNAAFDLYWKDVDGTAEETPIAPKLTPGIPNDWSADGRFILFTRAPDLNNVDLFALSLEQKVAHAILQTPFAESAARLSADGRWMAYVSNESGQNEVYVRRFAIGADGKPSAGPKWRVSTTGGVVPRWRRDGRELFYRSAAGDFMAVDVKVAGETVQTSLPHQLFPSIPGVHAWDVSADGQRFLISNPLRTTTAPSADPVTVVLNWKSALAK
jgi:eukaryotic-like serine/threonine-protein kinase